MPTDLRFLLLLSILSRRARRSLEPSGLPWRQEVINGGGNARHCLLCLLQRARLGTNVFCTLISIPMIDFSLNDGLAASWQQQKRA